MELINAVRLDPLDNAWGEVVNVFWKKAWFLPSHEVRYRVDDFTGMVIDPVEEQLRSMGVE